MTIHINTRAVGTLGYMAPEYAIWGHLTKKSDVHSFGTVTLELVSGRSVHSNHSLFLRDWALDLKKKDNLLELVDPRLGSDYDKVEVMMMINVALLYTNASPAVRPFMQLSACSMAELPL
ncbi:hypothetical protein Vadar_005750 [Vaccinium darrowii]|uniref:Uncharacterized protein n=1 Tax=Vaccinium darrowii TaxID=229202 RepID=A0ACB7YLJ8_9ERIC|nr:hypothetical protein Vadar_005750 [Vaccinium darrowii]